MLPFYPHNQHPAIDRYERETRPASRIEVRMQMLDHDRQRYARMERDANRHVPHPMTAVAHTTHQAIASLTAAIRHLVPRHAAQTPGSHICVPGVDC